MTRFFFFCFSLFVLVSCKSDEESFYEGYAEGDLYRLPIVYPYQLIRLYGYEKGMGLSDSWDLNFHWGGDKGSPGFSSHTNVREINVSNGIIYGCDVKHDDYPNVWFVIILDQKIEKVFKDKEKEWRSFLQQHGISKPLLYSVWKIFDEFKANSTLPWRKQE